MSNKLDGHSKEKGIDLVPVDDGIEFFLAEIQAPPDSPAEVVISASVKEISEWGLGRI